MSKLTLGVIGTSRKEAYSEYAKKTRCKLSARAIFMPFFFSFPRRAWEREES
jgi:hypothetical protein